MAVFLAPQSIGLLSIFIKGREDEIASSASSLRSVRSLEQKTSSSKYEKCAHFLLLSSFLLSVVPLKVRFESSSAAAAAALLLLLAPLSSLRLQMSVGLTNGKKTNLALGKGPASCLGGRAIEEGSKGQLQDERTMLFFRFRKKIPVVHLSSRSHFHSLRKWEEEREREALSTATIKTD